VFFAQAGQGGPLEFDGIGLAQERSAAPELLRVWRGDLDLERNPSAPLDGELQQVPLDDQAGDLRRRHLLTRGQDLTGPVATRARLALEPPSPPALCRRVDLPGACRRLRRRLLAGLVRRLFVEPGETRQGQGPGEQYPTEQGPHSSQHGWFLSRQKCANGPQHLPLSVRSPEPYTSHTGRSLHSASVPLLALRVWLARIVTH